MDFTLDETQQAVADLAASVLGSGAEHARVVAALASDAVYDEAGWKALSQAGLLGLGLPTDLGGDGVGAVEIALVLTAVGRSGLPLPALATLALGVLPIVAHGTPDQRTALLAEVPDGRVLAAALRDAPGSPVTRTGETLTGVRVGVPYAAQAHRLLVPTPDGTAVVDPHGPGLDLVRTYTSAGTPEYTVRLDRAPVETTLTAGPQELDRWAVLGAAAVADGVLDAALRLTADHVRSREQFGRPLAAFQAVTQQVADVYIAARTLHLAALSAAWRSATGRDADEDLAVAAYWLADQLPAALQTCHHLHGGLGVDITYPLHRYYSQGLDLARLVGGAADRLDRLGRRCSSN